MPHITQQLAERSDENLDLLATVTASAPAECREAAAGRGPDPAQAAGSTAGAPGLPVSAPAPACSSLTSGRCPSLPGLARTTCRRSSRTRREAEAPRPPGAPRSRRRDCMEPGSCQGQLRVPGPTASRDHSENRCGKRHRKRHHAESAGNSFPRRGRLSPLGPAHRGGERPRSASSWSRLWHPGCRTSAPAHLASPATPHLDSPGLPPVVALSPHKLWGVQKMLKGFRSIGIQITRTGFISRSYCNALYPCVASNPFWELRKHA